MNLVANLPAWLRSLFRGGREDGETREELRFHLEMETEQNLRADPPRWSEPQAGAAGRAQILQRLGDVQRQQEIDGGLQVQTTKPVR